MKFILPQGIGDSVWALHKIQSANRALGGGPIHVGLNCAEEGGVESRALDFVRRFSFVESARMLPGFGIHPQNWLDNEGRYIYIPSGPVRFMDEMYYALMPNGHLERGMRLESWLPEFEINWDIMDSFCITDEEKLAGESLKEQLGEYAVFYLGPASGNTIEGHNRGPMWTPDDWVTLGRRIINELGLKIVLVGAPYDLTYYIMHINLTHADQRDWICLIGETNVGQLYSVTMNSRFVISYQSGVGIVSSYLKVPTGIFWRPKGNSINPNYYISFEEQMASAWARPETITAGKHLPLIYGRHGVDYIMDQIKLRGW